MRIRIQATGILFGVLVSLAAQSSQAVTTPRNISAPGTACKVSDAVYDDEYYVWSDNEWIYTNGPFLENDTNSALIFTCPVNLPTESVATVQAISITHSGHTGGCHACRVFSDLTGGISCYPTTFVAGSNGFEKTKYAPTGGISKSYTWTVQCTIQSGYGVTGYGWDYTTTQ